MTDTTSSNGLIEGLKEALAWKRGELTLETIHFNPITAAGIKGVCKQVAKPAAK